MSLDAFNSSFKPETRSSGQAYIRKGVVTSSMPSDTEIQAYIRGATTYRIHLKSDYVSSDTIRASCTCQKGLCKHIWAALLQCQEKHPDFLDGKTEIEFADEAATAKASARPKTQAQIDSQAAYKTKQADFRKAQYQKQKQLLKEKKLATKKKKSAEVGPQFPSDVQQAIDFFCSNGFILENPLNAIVIGMAKKRLSRVFHPDIGGSHTEILELNKNYDILIQFVKDSQTLTN